MMKFRKKIIEVFRHCILAVSAMLILASCKKMYNLPEDKVYLSDGVNYPTTFITGVLGRTTLFPSSFVPDNSTFPLNFEIIDVKNQDPGKTPTDVLFKKKEIKVWTEAYTGREKSIEEIERKRKLEAHSIFEVRPSGEFVLWSAALNEDLLKTGSDSAYTFNVKVSNAGGEKIVGPITLFPARERPYEPSYHINQITGKPLPDITAGTGTPVITIDKAFKRLIPSTLTGMRGAATGRPLVREENVTTAATFRQDVWVYINRVKPAAGQTGGNTLTFKFMDKDSVAINPDKFDETDFSKLIHGFNMQKTSAYVRYDVAYPIPLTKWLTPYTTTDGSLASVTFRYSRFNSSRQREAGVMSLDFSIFKEGDWEIIFYFHNENPKFEDDY